MEADLNAGEHRTRWRSEAGRERVRDGGSMQDCLVMVCGLALAALAHVSAAPAEASGNKCTYR
jgi:hypothetical protein